MSDSRLTISDAFKLYRWGVNPFQLNEAYLSLPVASALPALARNKIQQIPSLPIRAINKLTPQALILGGAATCWIVAAKRPGGPLIPRTLRYSGLVFIGAVGAVVLTSAYQFAKYYLARRAPTHVEHVFGNTLSVVDFHVDAPTEADRPLLTGEGPASRRKRRDCFLPFAVRSLKSELGLMQDNAANRMVLRKKVSNCAEKHGIRPHHQQEFIDLAITLILTPSKKDIEAAQYAKTTSHVLREAEFAYWSGRKTAQ